MINLKPHGTCQCPILMPSIDAPSFAIPLTAVGQRGSGGGCHDAGAGCRPRPDDQPEPAPPKKNFRCGMIGNVRLSRMLLGELDRRLHARP